MLANIVSLIKMFNGWFAWKNNASLIASIFEETKIDPTIINGGVILNDNSAKLGKSEWSILEADGPMAVSYLFPQLIL